MEFNVNAYNEILTSNIAPQDHEFNAGIWNLEQNTRAEQRPALWL
jgi:DNA/RNA endonuclease G (NUC1)